MDGRYVLLAILAAGNVVVLVCAMFFGIYAPEYRNLQTIALVLGIVDSSIVAAMQSIQVVKLDYELTKWKEISNEQLAMIKILQEKLDEK